MFFIACVSTIFAFSATTFAYGLSARDLLTQSDTIIIPPTLSLNRAATLNGYGYTFYTISPLAQEFINAAGPGKNVLEIGAGFGNVAEMCLRQGVSEYTANDLCLDHLKILLLRLQQAFGKRFDELIDAIRVVPAKAPDVLPVVENYYDAILIEKVIHFFTPQETYAMLTWAYKALKKGGKLYLLTVSPYSARTFKVEQLLLAYEANRVTQGLYTGYLHQQPYLNETLVLHPNFVIPENILFFKAADLIAIFNDRCFRIDRHFFLFLEGQASDLGTWTITTEELCDLVAVIAVKE